MLIRFSLLFTLAVAAFAETVTFDHAVQIPEAVLQPGKYVIHLEDRLSDRAIVRITEPGGTDHYILSVPGKSLENSKGGLVYFTGADALHGWACSNCAKPLEFVYPKDAAVKLAAETGGPVLAFDPSYDKLPDNLSAADRKVVTLWLLAPKTVTPDGKGVGLTAVKYTKPRTVANAEVIPKAMPKTASLVFLELLAGFVSFIAGVILFLWRKVSALPKLWKMTGLTMLGGMVAGFALPAASSYQSARAYVPVRMYALSRPALEVPTVVDRDSEVEQLKARNRRLEAMVQALSEK